MAAASNLSREVQAWGSLAIVVVLTSVILGKFKDISGATTTTNATVDLFITGLQEPANWVVIVIVAAVGMYLFKKFGGTGAGRSS